MALRGTAFQANGSASTTCVINVSGIGIQQGDIVLLLMNGGGNAGQANFTFPSGFAAIPGLAKQKIISLMAFQVMYKVATGSEPSTYTVTSDQTDFQCAQCRVYSGRNQTSPFTAVAVTAPVAASATPISESFTGLTAAASDDLVLFVGNDNTNVVSSDVYALTAPSGFSNVVNAVGNHQFGSVTLSADLVNHSAGATGTLSATETSTPTGRSMAYAGFLISIATAANTPGLRGQASASFASGVNSYPINVTSIGIQPGDTVLLYIAGKYTATDPAWSFPAGFQPIPALPDSAVAGNVWFGVAIKQANANDTSYTIASVANCTLAGTVHCRVYKNISVAVTAATHAVGAGSASPMTISASSIVPLATDCVVNVSLILPNAAIGTQSYAPATNFSNGLIFNDGTTTQQTGIAAQDYINYPGGPTATVTSVVTDSGGETNIRFTTFLLSLSVAGNVPEGWANLGGQVQTMVQ